MDRWSLLTDATMYCADTFWRLALYMIISLHKSLLTTKNKSGPLSPCLCGYGSFSLYTVPMFFVFSQRELKRPIKCHLTTTHHASSPSSDT